MSILSISGLSASYGKEAVLKDINLSIDAGKIVGLLGANGSGKTTLIKAACNIIPHKGEIFLEEKDVSKLSSRALSDICGYIPQRSGINIDITVLDVVLMGFNPKLTLLQSPTKKMREDALEMIDRVGLSGFHNKSFQHLSEGQKQLCILARTFVTKKKLLLLDEPESALDFRLRYYTLSLLKDYVSANNSSAFVSLHDHNLALNFCDELFILFDGRISGHVYPKADSLIAIEKSLSVIYGNVSLIKVESKSGASQLVMIKEDL